MIEVQSSVAPIRAAQYLRMSTEHQRYSLTNQKAAIGQYATTRNIEIVESYIDPGRSGVSLKGRKALQALISDVISGKAKYTEILVLDVSRWGRFQDHDEPAHYEFLCRAAGVNVRYCGEPFENDGSAMSSIMKQIKRVMAAEYSRELSVKIARAQLQQAKLGFKQGGSMAYGVRRLLINKDGKPRFIMEPGEHKGLTTDRVVYVPGPKDEQEVVRRIFRLYVTERMSIPAICRTLTSEGIPGVLGKSWQFARVRAILVNEIFLGYYVWNRTTSRLQTSSRPNPPEYWARTKVMEPIVGVRIFKAAAHQLGSNRGYKYEDKRLLKSLRQLAKEGLPMSAARIEACPYTAVVKTYVVHFGSLAHALELIGYVKPEGERHRRFNRVITDDEMLAGIRRLKAVHGFLSSSLIDAAPDLPGSNFYKRRFGTILKAYALAGFDTTRAQLVSAARRRSRNLFPSSYPLLNPPPA